MEHTLLYASQKLISVPIVRSNSITSLSFLDEVDLENALLKSTSSIETPSTVPPSQETMYRWYFEFI